MPTIDIPEFWIVRYACGCVYGSILADPRFPGIPGPIAATEEQAWADFFEGRKRERARAEKAGHTVTGELAVPPIEEWAYRSHKVGACTRAGGDA